MSYRDLANKAIEMFTKRKQPEKLCSNCNQKELVSAHVKEGRFLFEQDYIEARGKGEVFILDDPTKTIPLFKRVMTWGMKILKRRIL